MDDILVSVIIPAYKCDNFITQALDSALIQDVPMEVLVIDDCSPDSLEQVMQKYLADPRVKYVKNGTNLGVAESRNQGMRLARGEYIAFLDADDCWQPGKLKRQLELIQEKKTVICSTARELMEPDGTLSGYIIPVMEDYTYRDIQRQNLINCSSVLIRRDVAVEFPMHHEDGHEDYLMWLEVLEKYGRGCAINEPLLKYRISNTGKSGNKWNSAKMTYKTYRYMGYGFWGSLLYFVMYAFHGIKKYFRWFLK